MLQSSLPVTSSPLAKASFDRRFIAFLIDSFVAEGLAFALGARSRGAPAWWAAVVFLLVRDVVGASPGKLFLGMRVVRRGDYTRPANILQRLGRNLVLAVATANAALTPLACRSAMGSVICALPLVAGVAWLLDAGKLYDDGERLSDRIVGTAVVR